MSGFSITRRIEIDMGHRVPTHQSKCWNLHGHRYVILATATSTWLQAVGEQQDMVMDFSFLKEAMMLGIHEHSDHGLTLWDKDPWQYKFRIAAGDSSSIRARELSPYSYYPADRSIDQTKLCIVPFIPTAEKLAEHWFKILEPSVFALSQSEARLTKLQVFETPNCEATYPVRVAP